MKVPTVQKEQRDVSDAVRGFCEELVVFRSWNQGGDLAAFQIQAEEALRRINVFKTQVILILSFHHLSHHMRKVEQVKEAENSLRSKDRADFSRLDEWSHNLGHLLPIIRLSQRVTQSSK